jgi:hypothetical protein
MAGHMWRVQSLNTRGTSQEESPFGNEKNMSLKESRSEKKRLLSLSRVLDIESEMPAAVHIAATGTSTTFSAMWRYALLMWLVTRTQNKLLVTQICSREHLEEIQRK